MDLDLSYLLENDEISGNSQETRIELNIFQIKYIIYLYTEQQYVLASGNNLIL